MSEKSYRTQKALLKFAEQFKDDTRYPKDTEMLLLRAEGRARAAAAFARVEKPPEEVRVMITMAACYLLHAAESEGFDLLASVGEFIEKEKRKYEQRRDSR